MEDIVDVRSFNKNSKGILKSEKVLQKAVRTVVGPTMKLHKDLPTPELKASLENSTSSISMLDAGDSKVSWSAFVRKSEKSHTEPTEVSFVDVESSSQSQLNGYSRTQSFRSTVSRSDVRHSSPAPSRPTTSSALPYIQEPLEYQAEQLEFSDLTAHPASYSYLHQHGRVSRNGRSSPMSPEHGASHNVMDLKGHFVPISYLKDTMIATVRRHSDHLHQEVLYGGSPVVVSDTPSLMSQNHGGVALNDSEVNSVKSAQHPLGSINRGESAFFSDSMKSLPIGEGDIPPLLNNADSVNAKPNSHHRSQSKFSSALGQGSTASAAALLGAGSKHRQISTKDIDESPAWKSLLSSTSRAKLASIVRIEDDYAVKWMKMKQRRDSERGKEEQRSKDEALTHLFRRIRINSEQNDLQQAHLHQARAEESKLQERQQRILAIRQSHDHHKQQEEERRRAKCRDNREMRITLERSVAEARRLRQLDVEENRSIHLEARSLARLEASSILQSLGQFQHPGFSSQHVHGTKSSSPSQSVDLLSNHASSNNLTAPMLGQPHIQPQPPWGGTLEELSTFSENLSQDGNSTAGGLSGRHSKQQQQPSFCSGEDSSNLPPHLPSVTLDESTSSVVPIPQILLERLRKATSLRAYQLAKKEIQDFHDQTMSQRLQRIAASKEIKRRRQESREQAQIVPAPFDAALFFADSVLSLESGQDLDTYPQNSYLSHHSSSSPMLRRANSSSPGKNHSSHNNSNSRSVGNLVSSANSNNNSAAWTPLSPPAVQLSGRMPSIAPSAPGSSSSHAKSGINNGRETNSTRNSNTDKMMSAPLLQAFATSPMSEQKRFMEQQLLLQQQQQQLQQAQSILRNSSRDDMPQIPASLHQLNSRDYESSSSVSQRPAMHMVPHLLPAAVSTELSPEAELARSLSRESTVPSEPRSQAAMSPSGASRVHLGSAGSTTGGGSGVGRSADTLGNQKRSLSIRKSLSGFLPLSASNFDQETGSHVQKFEKYTQRLNYQQKQLQRQQHPKGKSRASISIPSVLLLSGIQGSFCESFAENDEEEHAALSSAPMEFPPSSAKSHQHRSTYDLTQPDGGIVKPTLGSRNYGYGDSNSTSLMRSKQQQTGLLAMAR